MIGSKLAHYEITSHLGTGGMGEVYQAIDSKLGRNVAIKLLPAAFASDADRLARFQREAQSARVAESSQHCAHLRPRRIRQHAMPRDGTVEGETLQARIKRGPIPLDEALHDREADRGSAGSRAREGHHPSRSETRQREADGRRHGEGARLRIGEGLRPASPSSATSCQLTDDDQHGGNECGRDSRNGGVHESRAGAGQGRGQAHRHLGVRRGAV